MNKVSKKIREALQCIHQNNMIFINDNMNANENKINYLNKKIEQLKEEINGFNINENLETGITNENKRLLDNSNNEKSQLEKLNKLYIDLIQCIKQKKYDSAKNNAENLKQEYLKSIKDKLIMHKIGGCISGIIPFADILIQYFIKQMQE